MKKIILSFAAITLVAAVAIGATTAYFSDTETSEGNTFTAGSIDLTVNDDNGTIGALVTLPDMKPSQWFEVEKRLKVLDNPAKLYLHIQDITDDDCSTNEVNEPECDQQGGDWDGTTMICDMTNGTEVKNLNTKLTYDLCIDVDEDEDCDADDTIIIDAADHRKLISETANPDVGITSCWIPIKEVSALEEVVIRQSFHLQSETGNEYQSDTCSFTEEFKAVQVNATGDPTPICSGFDDLP
jgi:predicted ribosomally synthesized peptide with SipW-like signal peptide